MTGERSGMSSACEPPGLLQMVPVRRRGRVVDPGLGSRVPEPGGDTVEEIRESRASPRRVGPRSCPNPTGTWLGRRRRAQQLNIMTEACRPVFDVTRGGRMSQPRPDPGATRKPPSWLVFEDDGPWLQFGSALELSDLDRSHQLGCLEGYRRLPPPSQA
jgi:hypothetical protein